MDGYIGGAELIRIMKAMCNRYDDDCKGCAFEPYDCGMNTTELAPEEYVLIAKKWAEENSPTRKEVFISEFKDALADGCTKYVVMVRLPSGATEVIVNTDDLRGKMEYCDCAYDETLTLKSNPQIKLLDYMFG